MMVLSPAPWLALALWCSPREWLARVRGALPTVARSGDAVLSPKLAQSNLALRIAAGSPLIRSRCSGGSKCA